MSRDEIEDGMGCAGLVPSAKDRHVENLDKHIELLRRDNASMVAAIRCAYRALEHSAHSPIPSLLSVREALQALSPFVK